MKWTKAHAEWIENHLHLLKEKPNKYMALVEEFNNQFAISISTNQMKNWFSNRKRSFIINENDSIDYSSSITTITDQSNFDKSFSSKSKVNLTRNL